MVDGGGSSFRAVNSPNPGAATSDEAARPRAQHSDAMQGATPTSNGTAQSPEPAPQGASHSANSHAAAERDAQPTPPAPASPAALPPAQSQPAATATSAPVQMAAKDDTPSAASGYGTRSRNRPSAARPNYAEDIEMDFEMAPPNGSNGSSSERTTRSPAGGTDTGQSPAPNAKKSAATTNGTTASGPASRDPSIPGTLTFSANPNANVSTTQGKKRKAGGTHAAAAANSAAAAVSTVAASRRKDTTVASNMIRETNMMTFEKSGAKLKRGKLEADDGTVLSIDDHVYLVCEPPGEPYYLCRIMEFLHTDGDDPNSTVDSLRVNWFYRPRDVLRYNNDTRLVYGTMHSDICPLTSLRGKCVIRHRSEVEDFEEFRRTKDSFWFNQVFDRFIHRWYEVIPVSQVINVPEKVKKALDERWKFVVVETSRVKELTSAVKTCKRCSGYCAANDSVECAVCHNTYHMNCVRPPLLKKPSRGFAWACGPCGRAQERKLEARRTPIIGEAAASQEEEEIVDEEEEDAAAQINTTAPSPSGSDAPIDDHPATQAEIALAKMWPMRYLGIHCRVEDALQYDDRAIYPRASSRLGPRHQANVNVWHGRPVELVKPAEIRKRYTKGPSHKKDPKLSKEDLEADRAEKAKRPKWVQDEPVGYVRRGEDFPNDDPRCTAKTLFKMPSEDMRGEDDAPVDREKLIDEYMHRARAECAKVVGVPDYGTNFLTKAVELFYANNYDIDAAIEALKKVNRRKDLKEPELNREERKRFEEGVAKYGSELRNVRLHVRTVSHADIVRYYYLWKKTPPGKKIWGNYDGRKGKNQKIADSTSKLVDDIADNVDDSAFDAEKAESRGKSFVCKFCSTRKSRQWRRAPGVAPGQTVPADGRSKDKGTLLIPSLCQRCARLWRKYAIKYEDAEELIKKISATGGKKWRKMIDQELMDEINAAQNAPPEPVPSIEPIHEPAGQPTTEPPRKKQKGTAEKDSSQQASAEPQPKKKVAALPSKAPTPPPQPVIPKMRELPCAVCLQMEPLGDQRLVCRECRLTVHRQCYGVTESRSGKWVCDQCKNDKKETVSYTYECVLCPVKETEQELIEPPKVSHKKKTDKEREKERLEKELRIQKLKEYQQQQRDKGRPELPREPLKKTAENNWVHLHCAVWTPELKFTNPRTYELVEGVGTPTIKYDQVCKICKTAKGACVSCHQCHVSFHVGCAHSQGYTFGFDVTPVKSSRRDAVQTFTLGQETGSLAAAIWCKDHTPKSIVHPLNEVVDEAGTTALQLYVQNYKQADPTLTGTARKANLLDQFTKGIPSPTAAAPVNRRTSTVQSGTRSARNSSAGLPKTEEPDEPQNTALVEAKEERKCGICDIEVSPKWWKIEDSQDPTLPGSNPDQPVNTIEKPVGTPASQSEGPRFPNGIINTEQPPSRDVPASGKASTPDGIPVPRPGSYLCNKCHWRRKNKPELLKPPKKSPTPPPQPVRSPPRQYPPAPAPPLHHWPPIAAPPPHGGGSLPGWAGHPPPPISNGVTHSPQPVAPPHVPPPMHHPYHPAVPPHHPPPPNGYPPYSAAPTVLPPAQPGAIRSPYPPPTAPTPLHHTNSPMLAGLPNGIHSPHTAQFGSPAPGHIPPPRQTESPFAGLYGGSHGSPGPLHPRPETPRDGTLPPQQQQQPPPPPPQPQAQAQAQQQNGASGASASPNLRNLLH